MTNVWETLLLLAFCAVALGWVFAAYRLPLTLAVWLGLVAVGAEVAIGWTAERLL